MQGAREGPEASRGANTLLRDVVRVPSLWGRRVGRVAPGPECVGPKRTEKRGEARMRCYAMWTESLICGGGGSRIAPGIRCRAPKDREAPRGAHALLRVLGRLVDLRGRRLGKVATGPEPMGPKRIEKRPEARINCYAMWPGCLVYGEGG